MNVHKELIEAYAKDWMETDKPWTKWEYHEKVSCRWMPLLGHPWWDVTTQYRRKQATIMIGDTKVPAPMRSGSGLKLDECCYLPSLFVNKLYETYWWGNTVQCERLLARGLIHRTKEAAIAHAEALLKLTQEGDEE